MAVFTLTIHTRTKDFGEQPNQEQNMIQHVLAMASARIGSGLSPIPIKDRSGNEVATYEFGEGMLSHPDKHRYYDLHHQPARASGGLQPHDYPDR